MVGVKEELGAFTRSTSLTDMLRLLPWPTALIGVVASREGMVFLGDSPMNPHSIKRIEDGCT
jgi:hypothetical protein